MRETVRVTTTIEASAEKVWEMITDLSRMGEWSPEATGGVWIGGAPSVRVGAKFKGTNKNGSKSWDTTATVISADRGRLFAFRVAAAGFKVSEWRYEIEPTETGCRVTEIWLDERNALVKALGKPVSGVGHRGPHNRTGMEATLAALKGAAESS